MYQSKVSVKYSEGNKSLICRWALIRCWALINFFCLQDGLLFEVGANSGLGAYSNNIFHTIPYIIPYSFIVPRARWQRGLGSSKIPVFAPKYLLPSQWVAALAPTNLGPRRAEQEGSPNRFFRIRDLRHLQTGIRDFKAKWGRDSGWKVWTGWGMPSGVKD